jgi:hypothetical protein
MPNTQKLPHRLPPLAQVVAVLKLQTYRQTEDVCMYVYNVQILLYAKKKGGGGKHMPSPAIQFSVFPANCFTAKAEAPNSQFA